MAKDLETRLHEALKKGDTLVLRNPHMGTVTRSGKTIVGEKCRCSHWRHRHGGMIGHGGCEHTACHCQKYTWATFVTGE